MKDTTVIAYFVSLVIRVYGNGRIPQHRLRPRRGHNNLLGAIPAFNRVRKARDDTELELFFWIVPGYVQECTTIKLLLLDLQVGKGRIQADTPIDETVGAIEDTIFV